MRQSKWGLHHSLQQFYSSHLCSLFSFCIYYSVHTKTQDPTSCTGVQANKANHYHYDLSTWNTSFQLEQSFIKTQVWHRREGIYVLLINQQVCLCNWLLFILFSFPIKGQLWGQMDHRMNHRRAWVEKDHNHHQVSTLLLWAGSPTTRPGCPEQHRVSSWMPPGMGNPQPHWATCSSASPPSVWKTKPPLS